MRTRAKQKHVASDRVRRPKVPRHILFHPNKIWLARFRSFSSGIRMSDRE